MIKISPSILSADFSKMGEELKSVASADSLHYDVMDGNFVDNITFGPKMLKDIRKYTDLPIEAHLMITRPGFFATKFLEAGADALSFHIEATDEAETFRILSEIRKFPCRAGLAISPDTSAVELKKFAELLDFVVVMTVYPGFGAQGFLPGGLNKIAEVRAAVSTAEIIVDGGVNANNAKEIVAAGADTLICGNAVFGAPNRAAAIEVLRCAVL